MQEEAFLTQQIMPPDLEQ
jgi:hypothetical protein